MALDAGGHEWCLELIRYAGGGVGVVFGAMSFALLKLWRRYCALQVALVKATQRGNRGKPLGVETLESLDATNPDAVE